MVEELRPILLEDLRIVCPAFSVRRVALNQHMPRVERLTEHRHDFHQMLLYLRGKGTQHVETVPIPVERGSLLTITAGRRHRFEKEGTIRPVCLAIDVEMSGPVPWVEEAVLSEASTREVERLLVELHERESSTEPHLAGIPQTILHLFSLLEETARSVGKAIVDGPMTAKVRRILESDERFQLRPGEVADRLGFTLDHLNRELAKESGHTVGRLRDSMRIKTCGHLLRTSALSLGEVGEAVGFDDRNYFSRWFRKRTGQTPSRWRAAMR